MDFDPNNGGYYLLILGVVLTIVAAWFASRDAIAKAEPLKRFLLFVLFSALPIGIFVYVAATTPIFAAVWWLLLLALIPIIWHISCESLTSMGNWRRFFALALRTLVLLTIVVALAELQFLRVNNRMTVLYLLDQSESIPKPVRQSMVRWAKQNSKQYRGEEDFAGVIPFGRDAAIEVAPIDDDLPMVSRIETPPEQLRPDATNLAQALKLAQATFPEDSSRRVVIVSDGNENEGDAKALIEELQEGGVSVDVAPIQLTQRAEVEVEKVAIPADTRKGQPFDAKVVINNLAQPTEEDDGNVEGTIRVWRRQGKQEEMITEQDVSLIPGKNVMEFRNTIEEEDFYEYQAVFVPKNPKFDDVLEQNNRATAFTQVLGAANVLLIENWETAGKGHFDHLIERLSDQEINITTQTSDQLFTSLAELQRYDCVILADVPRSSGNVDVQTNFSDEQINILVRNTQKLGCGLIMIGGQNSFGAGGWSNSELEKAMPVDFQIYNAKVIPVGALAMVMHASEMAQGNYWQKIISREALKVLGPHDFCGVVHWGGKEEWLWGKPQGLIKVGQNKKKMMARLGQMTPGDMPEFDPSLKMAVASFSRLPDAAVKHMIVISDGDPSPPTNATLQAYKNLKVKISTVAVGTHGAAGSGLLSRIAKFTGGRYYVVRNPKALPRIFQKETMRVARPLVKEKPDMEPILTLQHEIVKGIDAFPPFHGFVLTSKKENPLVDVILKSPEPADNPAGRDNNTLLAAWTYGAGRTACFTTDAGYRWAKDWTSWTDYDRFFGQLIRWAMRPTGDKGQFNVATQIKNGEGKVIVTAMDKEGNVLNFLNVVGDVIRPDLTSADVNLKQTAPGRYEGTFDATTPGSYFIAMSPGEGYGSLRTGLNVPYSAEYQDRETNDELLLAMSKVEVGGEAGKVYPVNFEENTLKKDETAKEESTFRRSPIRPVSTQDIWPLLMLLTGCLFLSDIFIRRVAVNFDWVAPLLARMRSGEQEDAAADERMARLRSRKAEVTDELVERKAAARFEPSPEEDVDMSVLDQSSQLQSQAMEKKREQQSMESEKEEESYTERLLKAKEQAKRKQ